ncbi:RWD domain-containing protein 2A-like [Daphnia pulex]|uniref:RWD domain-containing protein 2A-like n=1 Tax=Daphnia pulex TaxID=6669 RepID=UPI001EE0E217|nr:RWD domain-containing protein 2A-like [Daphnia pulex]
MDSNSDVENNIELQLSELEMLGSMFPNKGELELIDPGVISDLHDFLSGKLGRDKVPKLEYNINLNIMEAKVNISVSLPNSYPSIPAQISVHSGHLGRTNHNGINLELRSFQRTLEPESIYIGSVVEWVKDNFPAYLTFLEGDILAPISKTEDKKTFRMWIHSHHIYSKSKMKNIEDWAKELNLTGFFLPGKPGLICVEGLETNCNIWWQRIRALNWQKISCKLEEHDEVQKFQNFSNIADIKASSDSSGMKAFLNYLEEHHSSHVFKEYFGFDGK